MYAPTAGQGYLNGYNIRTDMAKARSSLGLCPQHNMLIPDLTVMEHLTFFGMLKGLSWSETREQARRYIQVCYPPEDYFNFKSEEIDRPCEKYILLVQVIRLDSKANVAVGNLSGGMKRKVNLGMALIGDSEVVMLDEPTSGMDPEARREIWDLLEDAKKNRTILLTTHYMEEADVLSDRIAIMVKGRVYCNGSPMFLKRQLGTGYSLTMTKDENCDIVGARNLIHGIVPEASLKNEAGGELIFNLPDSGKEQES